MKEIENRDFASAQEHLYKTISYLRGFSGDPECDKLYISTALSLSDIWVRVPESPDELLTVLHEASEISRHIGDERHLAEIYLHMGRLYHMLSNPTEALRVFELGLNLVGKLGDEDIMARSAEFFGIYEFIQGRVKEASEYFEKAMSFKVSQPGRLFNHVIPAYFGNCTVYLGQFYRAIGVIDSHRHRALLQSDHMVARFYEALLGSYLLMMGNRREALFHLKTVGQEARAHNDIFAFIWSQRALAYYHYLEGRTQESYILLKECLARVTRAGLQKPFYSWPWILELLFEYHQRGFVPIPEYDFEQEMEIALGGINIHLRGVALRLKSKQAEMQGDDPSDIQELLEKSEADLEQVQDPLELAKTRADLALIKLRLGREDNALNLALQAWEGLSIYGYESFPGKLKSLIQKESSLGAGQSKSDEILKRYINLMDGIIPTNDPNELYFKLVSATSRFFEAERGALFLVEVNRPVLRTGYNLTLEEIEDEEFRSNLSCVFKALKNNEPVVVRLPQSRQGHRGRHVMEILCLPFDVDGRVRGLLYHDNRYSDGTFKILDKPILKLIAQNMGNYVVKINEYCRHMEERSRIALRQTTYDEEYDELEIKAQSRAMRDLLERTDRAAKTDAPILILGETGVGKELLARRLHAMSPRHSMPFIAVNLSTIPETLVESELFGHEKGAFTGADSQKPGRMELANKGTLFFDEIGDIPKSVQVKILRALEEKTFFRVGGTCNQISDFRLVAATNRDMLKEVENGNFREDLFYRLSVVPLIVPPLRKRGDDVVVLARHFLAQYARKYNQPVPELRSEDRTMLRAYHWPGNVRELKNVIERAMVLSNGEKLELTIPRAPKKPSEISTSSDNPFSDKPTMDELQRRYIRYILKETGGKLSGLGGASEIMGMKRSTLYTRVKKLGVSMAQGH